MYIISSLLSTKLKLVKLFICLFGKPFLFHFVIFLIFMIYFSLALEIFDKKVNIFVQNVCL